MPAKTMEDIAELLERVKFRHRLFGGVDEDDVWRIIDKLQKEYRAVVDAQQERSAALLEEREQYIAQLEESLRKARARARSEGDANG